MQIFYAGLGGHGSVAFSLAEANAALWDNQFLVTGVEPPFEGYETRGHELNASFDWVPKRPGIDLMNARLLHRIIRARRPQSILVHSTSSILPAVTAAQSIRANTIQVEHQTFENRTRSDNLWLWIGAHVSDAMIFLSPHALNAGVRQLKYSLRTPPLHVIPNGISTEFFTPRVVHSKGEGGVTITMAARFTPHRDHITLIDAIRRIHASRRFHGLKLILLGAGSTWCSVRAHVHRSGMDNVVYMPGSVSEAQVRETLTETTIYVHSSLSETMSTAVLQAMAMGLPMVLSDIPGNRAITNGHEDFASYFTPLDEEQLAARIIELIENPHLRSIRGLKARAITTNFYSNTIMAARYHHVVDQTRLRQRLGTIGWADACGWA